MRAEDDDLQTTGREVAVLPLETGGCGACAQSIAALHSPHYRAQLAASHITLVSSPRHADVVLLAGPLSTQSDQSVRRVLDLVPQPQVMVAVGDCAINGCVFNGSAEICASAAEALDVHIELPGCPPTPASILTALVRAAQLLDESFEDDTVPDSEDDGEEDEEGGENGDQSGSETDEDPVADAAAESTSAPDGPEEEDGED